MVDLYKQQWRAAKQEKGQCIHCPDTAVVGKTQCPSCAAKGNARCKARVIKAATEGRCTRCFVAAPRVGKKTCQSCQNRLSTYEKNLRKRCLEHGITPEQYNVFLTAQEDKCAICFLPRDGRWKILNIDHDHSTGIVRGLLCTKCNRGLGFFNDDAPRLISAGAYIAHHEQKVAA